LSDYRIRATCRKFYRNPSTAFSSHPVYIRTNKHQIYSIT